jgi:cytochrome P450
LKQSEASHEEIFWDLCFFLFAGHDTTSSAFIRCIFEMTRFPEHKAKILSEVNTYVSGDASDFGSAINSEKLE